MQPHSHVDMCRLLYKWVENGESKCENYLQTFFLKIYFENDSRLYKSSVKTSSKLLGGGGVYDCLL